MSPHDGSNVGSQCMFSLIRKIIFEYYPQYPSYLELCVLSQRDMTTGSHESYSFEVYDCIFGKIALSYSFKSGTGQVRLL